MASSATQTKLCKDELRRLTAFYFFNSFELLSFQEKLDILNISSLSDLAYCVGTVASPGPVHHNKVHGFSMMGCSFMETFPGRLRKHKNTIEENCLR